MSAPSPGGSAIAVAGLLKDYGERRVINDLHLQIGWGQIVALFGANGAGKTTLLRILAGLARPDAGRLEIGGRRVHRAGDAARTLTGFVGHDTMLYGDLTCRENLRFYGKLYAVSRVQRRIDDVLDMVGLTDRRDRRVRTLSHGMQRRLSVARAILHEPSVLLMDEPESGLDQASTSALGELLRAWANEGKSVFFTTHNDRMGFAWADRVLGLSQGRLTFDAPVGSTDAAKLQAALQPGLPA